VNVLGGFGVGVFQQGLSLADALRNFTLLTVGDGLVSQIPALLISTATGIMVTRAASEANLGRDVLGQFARNPRALGIAGAVLLVLAAIPGLPKLPFLVIGGLAVVGAWTINRNQAQAAVAAQAALQAEASQTKQPENVVELLTVDPMELEIGYGLIPLVDQDQGGNLLSRITMI